MKTKQKYAAIIILILFCTACIAFINLPAVRPDIQNPYEAYNSYLADLREEEILKEKLVDTKLSVDFSQKHHFYAEDLMIELSVVGGSTRENADVEIYYTLDSETPDKDHGILYTSLINIQAHDDINAHVIKAIAYSADEKSDVFTHTYFVGKDVHGRFNTYVVSLSTDPDHLYGHENGILVPGKLREDYIRDNPEEKVSSGTPANFNLRGRDGERPVYVEIWDSQENLLVSHAAGVRVHGGYSRANEHKSLRLIARKEYDPENGKFKYPFFDTLTSDTAEEFIIDRFDQLILRHGGNDARISFLREELVSRLALQSGFRGARHCVPVSVFINGEYYGFSWLHNRYKGKDIAYINEVEETDVYYVDIVEKTSETKARITGDEKDRDDFRRMYSYSFMDLTDDAALKELEGLLDIDNFLRYYALRIYINEQDWPRGNMSAYKLPDSESDGRWRYLLYDSDVTFLDVEAKSISRLLGRVDPSDYLYNNGNSSMLQALLMRKDLQDKFSNIICDYANTIFSPQVFSESIDTLYSSMQNEIAYNISKFGYPQKIETYIESYKTFVNERFSYIKSDLMNLFGYSGDMYFVSIKGAEGANAFLNTIPLESGQSVSGSYFIENSIILSAEADFEHEFDCWIVNGKRYNYPAIELKSLDGAEISAELFVRPKPFDELMIRKVYFSSNRDWIELYNPTEYSISTKGYFLSDDAEHIKKYALKSYTINPGGTLMVACKNNRSNETLMWPITNFNLKSGETLFLSDFKKNVSSTVLLQELRKDQHLVFDFKKGMYRRAPCYNNGQ